MRKLRKRSRNDGGNLLGIKRRFFTEPCINRFRHRRADMAIKPPQHRRKGDKPEHRRKRPGANGFLRAAAQNHCKAQRADPARAAKNQKKHRGAESIGSKRRKRHAEKNGRRISDRIEIGKRR